MTLGHIQRQRPSGARMAPTKVVPIWHIRRQKVGGAKMAPNQEVPRWHIRRQRSGRAEVALAITTHSNIKSLASWPKPQKKVSRGLRIFVSVVTNTLKHSEHVYKLASCSLVTIIDLVVHRPRFGLFYMFQHLIRVKIVWIQTNGDVVTAY